MQKFAKMLLLLIQLGCKATLCIYCTKWSEALHPADFWKTGRGWKLERFWDMACSETTWPPFQMNTRHIRSLLTAPNVTYTICISLHACHPHIKVTHQTEVLKVRQMKGSTAIALAEQTTREDRYPLLSMQFHCSLTKFVCPFDLLPWGKTVQKIF